MKKYQLWKVGDNIKLLDVGDRTVWYWSPGYRWDLSAWYPDALKVCGSLLGEYRIKLKH